MILSIGEILVDMISENLDGITSFNSFCGGAPFNVAVNAKQSGSKVGFIGRVGKDVPGRFLISRAKDFNLDYLDIQEDENKNTTLAFVKLDNGERDFAFNRYKTADYFIDFKDINFDKFNDLSIINLGSLMLSEKEGRKFAKKIVRKAKNLKVKLSFDVNFRLDIYKDFNSAKKAYKYFIENADIVKFSDDEIKLYTGLEDISEAVKSIIKNNQLIIVTMGAKGCMYFYENVIQLVESEKVLPIDTTGAGDAFFGAFLAHIDNFGWSLDSFLKAATNGNKKGAKATQFYGAVSV